MVTIASDEELENWLKTRPKMDAMAISARAALRVFPLWGQKGTSSLDLPPEDFACLPALRSLLTISVAAKFNEIETANAVSMAVDVFRRSEPKVPPGSDSTLAARVISVASDALFVSLVENSIFSLFTVASTSALCSVQCYPDSKQEKWAEFQADAILLENHQDLMIVRLWSTDAPKKFSDYDKRAIHRMIYEFGSSNSFWHRWWNGIKSGEPLDWDLQRDIALIPDEIWQQGPRPVQVEIAKIEERYALKAEVAALREQLQQVQTLANASASAAHRSHNQPPELIDDQIAIAQQITVIVNVLIETEAELALPQPSPGKLRILAEALIAGARAIVLYIAKLTDKFLVKVVETAAVTVTGKLVITADWSTVADKIAPIGRALLEFAKKLYGS